VDDNPHPHLCRHLVLDHPTKTESAALRQQADYHQSIFEATNGVPKTLR
jgi:hypothetical protein